MRFFSGFHEATPLRYTKKIVFEFTIQNGVVALGNFNACFFRGGNRRTT